MKKRSLLWVLTLLLSGLSTLTGCSSNDLDLVDLSETDSTQYELYELMGLIRKKVQSDCKGIVVKLFERNGMKLQVVDITSQFEAAIYMDDKKIPVNHVYVEQLPSAIQEMAIGASIGTRICRLNYKGEYYYDIFNLFSSSWVNFYNSKGERHDFHSIAEYEEFVSKVKDFCCILVLTTKEVENADGAPHYLVGCWQTNWQYLVHDHNQL